MHEMGHKTVHVSWYVLCGYHVSRDSVSPIAFRGFIDAGDLFYQWKAVIDCWQIVYHLGDQMAPWKPNQCSGPNLVLTRGPLIELGICQNVSKFGHPNTSVKSAFVGLKPWTRIRCRSKRPTRQRKFDRNRSGKRHNGKGRFLAEGQSAEWSRPVVRFGWSLRTFKNQDWQSITLWSNILDPRSWLFN